MQDFLLLLQGFWAGLRTKEGAANGSCIDSSLSPTTCALAGPWTGLFGH